MRVGIYLRVSTNDKGQTVETQRLPLAEWCAASGHTVVGEWSDEAGATRSAPSGWWHCGEVLPAPGMLMCLRCGHWNRPDASACGKCGRSLGERRS